MVAVSDTRDGTRLKIVEEAARLLRDHGGGAVTTRGVAKAAGVQAPTIYRLFGDKDGLLDAVAEQVMAQHVSAKSRTVDAASNGDIDPLDDLRSGWTTHIDFGLANPTLFALLSDPGRPHSAAARSGRVVLESRVHRVARTGRLRVSEQRAVDLIHAAGTGVVLSLISSPPEDRDLGLADEMYDAVLARILTDVPARADVDAKASAVALRAQAPDLDVLSESEQRLLTEWLDRVVVAGQVDGAGLVSAPSSTPRRGRRPAAPR